MAYRSTEEKAEAQKVARKLYVRDGLSLKEIRQQTGEAMKTLRSWCTLGDWETLRLLETKTELNRLRSLRDDLFDKAEAQIKADKLPHTELGLVYKLERLIVQREKKEEKAETIMMNTLQYLVLYLMEHDRELARAFASHLEGFPRWIVAQDLTRPPKEVSRSMDELTRQQQEQQGFPRPRQEFARRQQEFAHPRR